MELQGKLSKDDMQFVEFFKNDDNLEELYTRAYQHEMVGPKWTTIDDISDTHISMTSAWSEPTDGVQRLIAELAELDPDMVTSYMYEEEQPDVSGVYVYKGSEVYDGYEDDADEIHEVAVNYLEGFKESLDEDGDYTDESWDIWHDGISMTLEEHKQEFLANTLDELLADEKEDA